MSHTKDSNTQKYMQVQLVLGSITVQAIHQVFTTSYAEAAAFLQAKASQGYKLPRGNGLRIILDKAEQEKAKPKPKPKPNKPLNVRLPLIGDVTVRPRRKHVKGRINVARMGGQYEITVDGRAYDTARDAASALAVVDRLIDGGHRVPAQLYHSLRLRARLPAHEAGGIRRQRRQRRLILRLATSGQLTSASLQLPRYLV